MMVSTSFANQSFTFKRLLSEAGNLHSQIGIAFHQRFQRSKDRIDYCLNHYQQAVKFYSLHSQHTLRLNENSTCGKQPVEILQKHVCSLRNQYDRISIGMKHIASKEEVPHSFQELHYFDKIMVNSQDINDGYSTYNESTDASSLLFFTLFNMASLYHQILREPFMACTLLEKAMYHAPNLSYSIIVHNNLACLWSEIYGNHEDSIVVLENALMMTEELEADAHMGDGDQEARFGFIRRIKIYILLNLTRAHYLMMMLDDAADFYQQYTLVRRVDSSDRRNCMEIDDVDDDNADGCLGAAAA